ncbi:hypothetical protein EPUL_005253 [Erysiphe pulchra]|uniref:Uncharacterized protein n=1 Tax=Erysiphe pulchra TaxID=225359 RepID=A0A2S4PMJ7_9PEZI|nr:hypothetical protein EPUL_005253 [Erysiphe pulchra]
MIHSPRDEAHQIPDYLTKEPREIIERCQYQEIAWYIRLSVCVSVACNVESTLQMYKGDTVKHDSKSAKAKNTPSKNIKEINLDNKLFLRLPLDHEWHNFSPAGLREVIVKHLAASPASIGLIKPVCTGFAISSCSRGAREALLRTNIGLFDTGAKLKPATNWGQTEVTKKKLASEIERVTSIRPTSVRFYGTLNTEAPHWIWIAHFGKYPRPNFRVFDECGSLFKKKKTIDFCKRCYPTRDCPRAPFCGYCGSCIHSQKDCKASTKCSHYGGPHRSDSHKYLASLSRYGGPIKEPLKTFRIVGEWKYQVVTRTKAAEKRATSATESIVISNSQSPKLR